MAVVLLFVLFLFGLLFGATCWAACKPCRLGSLGTNLYPNTAGYSFRVEPVPSRPGTRPGQGSPELPVRQEFAEDEWTPEQSSETGK